MQRTLLNRISFLLLGVSLLLQAPGFAKQRIFEVPTEDPGNKVSFTSDAPIELIHGTTNKINGSIAYDESFLFDAKHPFSIRFDVDLASIDTGIALRNEHMRDNFLETGKYPKATFVATKIQSAVRPPFKNGQVVNLIATGPFTIHGKTVTKTIPIRVTNRGDKVRIHTTFPVSFNAHSIKRPELVLQKLAETVFVTVDALAQEKK